MKWTVNVPVWGDDYRRRFCESGLRSIMAAFHYANADRDIRFVVYTDRPGFLDEHLRPHGSPPVAYRPVPHAVNSTCQLGNADRTTIHDTEIGEAILFANADMTFSREVFAACERRFAQGKVFISCPSIRTVERSPPVGVPARDLLTWSWANRHQFTRDCVYGKGQVKAPPYVFFEHDGSIVMHAFDLHPLAIHKTRQMEYSGPTASEIISMFSLAETHIVDTPNEMAIAEPAGPDLPYTRYRRRRLDRRTMVRWGKTFSTRIQHDQFRRQILIFGHHNDGAHAVAGKIANESAQRIADNVRDDIDRWGLPSKIDLALMVPYFIRQMIPKPMRQAVLNWEWE